MKLLAFDTTLETCSAALSADDNIVAHRSERRARGHAEALLPMIEAVLADAGIGYADLDALGVTVGPGGFAGQRIGLAAARGIGLARALPVQGVTTLAAIAYGVASEGLAEADEDIYVALDARRGQIYAQAFAQPLTWPQRQSEPRAIALGDIKTQIPAGRCLVVGTGTALVEAALDDAGLADLTMRYLAPPTEADARHVAALALCEIAGRGLPTVPPSPLYLRAPDAKLPGGRSL
jgi:tRNA threonylcarbamoyladenosine biosynthesis protein TsaB